MSPQEEKAEALRVLVKEQIAEIDDLEPHVLSDKLIAGMSSHDLEDALRVTLPGFIRTVLTSMRKTSLKEKKVSGKKQKERATTGRAARRRKRSIADDFPLHVPGEGYVRLTVATPDQLELAAIELESQAAGLTTNAGKYRALAVKVRKTRGAHTVGDLTDDQIREAMTA